MSERHLWSGRFTGGMAADMLALSASIDVDIRLLDCDLEATKAHARALLAAGLLEPEEIARIDAACEAIGEEWETGKLSPGPLDEDVHSFVERELTLRLGETGARIHAGRSRNDLVATDLRLWCKARAALLAGLAAGLVDALATRASDHTETLMPGYTHLQRAQPVTLGFHFAAHGFALARDARRFLRAADAADECVMGAGALAGTTLPIDPRITADFLGFSCVYDNAMDAVSDRDFVTDLLYACALCGVHLSRLAEEIVLWTSAEFGFARLKDEWSTGSSMMPQKRNPDLAELLRGRAAVGVGELGSMFGLLKGLPLAYNRDLQEDKALVFGATDRTAGCLGGAVGLIGALEFDAGAMGAAAAAAATWATDLAEALVGRGVPFREAHAAVGGLVADLERRGLDLASAPEGLLRSHHPSFEAGDLRFANPALSVSLRDGHGGPAPARVGEQIGVLQRTAAELLTRAETGADPAG